MSQVATAEPFSRKLRWALLGVYVVLFGGALVVQLIRTFYQPQFFTMWLAIGVFVALAIQVPAAGRALYLLARDARYRSWTNIALALGGVIPIVYLVASAMIFGVRFHM